jgi:cobalt-zinc-cadmium resistance protein CzcA
MKVRSFLRGNFPSGITIQENASYAPKIRKIIAKYPQIAFVITQTGRNDDGTDPFQQTGMKFWWV